MKGEVADRFRFRPFIAWRVLIVVVTKEAFGHTACDFLVSHHFQIWISVSRSQIDLVQNRVPSVQYKGGTKIHTSCYFFTRTSSIVGEISRMRFLLGGCLCPMPGFPYLDESVVTI